MQTPRIPKPRHHKPSNQARIRYEGRAMYLGRWESPEAHRRYAAFVQRLLGGEDPFAADEPARALTIGEIKDRYWRHAKAYYVRPDGSETSEIECLDLALKPLVELFGNIPAAEFGPTHLKAVREVFVSKGTSRVYANKQVCRIRRVCKWAVVEGLVGPELLVGLQALEPLKRGRSRARETEPVRPVPDSHIQRVLPLLPGPLAALVQLQLLTGARPGELLGLRGIDLDTTDQPWVHRVQQHKTAYRGHEREILIGPKAQDILRPLLQERGLHQPLFSPKAAEADRLAERHRNRKTPPGQGNSPGTNRKEDPIRTPGDVYTTGSYRKAIHRACREAKVPIWSPNRLRHNAATLLRSRFGLDAAGAILGHRQLETTQIYAEKDRQRAREVIQEIG